MGPKICNEVKKNDSPICNEVKKVKRGRKSKKELMESLNMSSNYNEVKKDKSINLCVSELNDKNVINNDISSQIIYNKILEPLDDTNEIKEDTNIVIISNPSLSDEQKPQLKKRGRKPKGGKIIHQVVSNEPHKEDKQNVILHLKCSMKDLNNTNQDNYLVESYNLIGGKNDLSYDIIGSENINTVNTFYNDKCMSSSSCINNDCDDDDDEIICKDSSKEIWKKLKQLETNLHINNVNNRRSACFWDTCEFDNPPIYIPKHFINDSYHVYGCFCSPECGVAYLMNENIDSSTKFERYHLFNHIYSKIYDYKKNIKPAPNPYYMLEKYYGNLSIQEYRSLLRNERLFLIVDKPLTRILPELHEDNDDFILNNKIIPSNNYQVKARLQKKKQNKNSILNEKFGISNQNLLE
jgi:hypothetical protein